MRVDSGPRTSPASRTVKVREYSLAGGVHVHRV
ncbi:hypothetical protein BJ973_004801 [Actinoplanes tereljensis]